MKTIIYNEQKYLDSLKSNEKQALLFEITESLNHFIDDITDLNYSLIGTRYLSIYQASIIENTLEEIKAIKDFTNFTNLIREKMELRKENILNKIIKGFKPKATTMLNNFIKIVQTKLKKLIFKFFLWNKTKDHILYLEEVAYYHLLVIKEHTKKIIYEKTNLDIKEVVKTFGFNIEKKNTNKNNLLLETNETITNKSNLVYINMNYQIRAANIYSQNTYYVDLREMFNKENFHPNLSFISKQIRNNIKRSSKIYIVLPLFIETSSTLLKSSSHGYFGVFYKYPKYYQSIIKEVINLRNDYEIYITIPQTMNYASYIKWRIMIKNFLTDNELNKVQIGLIIDEPIYSEIEDIGNVDFVIIDFDELSYTYINSNGDMDAIIFKNEIQNTIRTLHSFFKNKKMEHIIMSKNLKNKVVMEKLMKIGYTKYIYPQTRYKEINTTFLNFMSRRGKYVGLSNGRTKNNVQN